MEVVESFKLPVDVRPLLVDAVDGFQLSDGMRGS